MDTSSITTDTSGPTLPTAPAAPALRLPRVNFSDREFMGDPHPLLKATREMGRVVRDRLGNYVLCHHADVDAAMRDRRLSNQPWDTAVYKMALPFGEQTTLERVARNWLMFSDAPKHTRIRYVATAMFKPPVIEALREMITQATDALLDQMPQHGTFDLMSTMAGPLPLQVMCHMVGVSSGDFERSKRWATELTTFLEPEKARHQRLQADEAVNEMQVFLREQIALYRNSGRSGTLLDLMIAAHEEDGTLHEDELLANLSLFFVAGMETTTNMIGNGMYTLLRHPQELARLRADLSLVPSTVEEVLRFEGSNALTARFTTEPYQVGDITIPPKRLMYLWIAAANRDPTVFPDAERFDVGRHPNPQLAFGGGVHYCIGAPLARLEGEIVFTRLLQRYPHLELVDETPDWRPQMNFRGFNTLRLRAP